MVTKIKHNLPENTSIVRVYKYRRVSTAKQVQKGGSLQDQDDVLDTYIADNENMVCVGEFVDGGVSGRKVDRNDFKSMMDGVNNNEVDLIIFTRLDRWFRNLRHYLNTNAVLMQHKVEWLAVEQPYYETRTAAGRAFVANSMSFAEFLAENNSEAIKDHNNAKVERGEVLSGSVPLGYKIENKHLVFSDKHYVLVDVIEFYERTHSMNLTLQHLLNVHGISMSQASFKKSILANTKIAGIFRSNNNYCPATISLERFSKLQTILSMNVKYGKKNEYIFSGLVYCADCNRAMSACQQRSGCKYSYNAYRCNYAVAKKICIHKKIFYESTMERYVLSNIRPALESYIAEYELQQLPQRNNRNKRVQLEKKIDKLKELYLNDLITLDVYKIDRSDFMQQLDLLNDNDDDEVKDLSSLKNFLESDFESIYKTLDMPEKRLLWRSVIKQIRIDHNQNVSIIFL